MRESSAGGEFWQYDFHAEDHISKAEATFERKVHRKKIERNMADDRFQALSTDPRYRLPKKSQAQTAVDSRFKGLFTDEEFQRKAKVDRYGRQIKIDSGKKHIQRRYRLEEDDQPVKSRPVKKEQIAIAEASNEDDTEDEVSELETAKARDPAREGFTDSSSDEESTEEEESDVEDELAEETAGNEQTEDVPMGEVSRRIAAVNLDWDNIRATDIMAVARSFAPSGGRIAKVSVYPSEFGRDRMEKEELEGPPREIFTSSKRENGMGSEDDDDSEDDEDERIKKRLLRDQANDGEEFNTAALRQYQLERLRYYYAVIVCDSDATAKALYESMDGREYLTTANFFDLRFIPDETSFDDDEPRDECSKISDDYKPNDFRTEALTHSKVRLTWDDDDTTRKEVQKRAFSRAEMDENDLQAYIGSDSSDAESVVSRKSASEDRKVAKREAAKLKMRSALGLPKVSSKSARSKADEPMGDMQITFSAGLSTKQNGNGVFENEPQDEESTRDRYIRKERERKQKRKEKMKASRVGAEETTDAPAVDNADVIASDDDERDPFDDPFFNDPAAAATAEKAARNAERQTKREAKAAHEQAAASRRAELELLMADDDKDAVRHFDMKEIEKAQKDARRKKSKKGKKNDNAESAIKDDFRVEADDPRFKALFQSHEYAIDPTNPRFKGTEGMKTLLEEGRKKRKRNNDELEVVPDLKGTKPKKGKSQQGSDLNGLVARLKTNSRS